MMISLNHSKAIVCFLKHLCLNLHSLHFCLCPGVCNATYTVPTCSLQGGAAYSRGSTGEFCACPHSVQCLRQCCLYCIPYFPFILFVHPLQSEFYLLKQFCGLSDADCLEALEYTSGETHACLVKCRVVRT